MAFMMVTGPVGFVTRPMTVILFVISIAAIAWPIYQEHREKKKAKETDS